MSAPVRSWSERIYSLLLHLYPAGFRREVGLDLREFFRDQLREARSRRFGVARLWLRALTDVFTTAFLEHLNAIRAPFRAPVALPRLALENRP